MSETFERFGEAARLYAKYAAVVDQMYSAFRAEIVSFVNAVQDRLSAQAAHGRLRHGDTNFYRYWWLADDGRNHNGDFHVWLDKRPARIVVPGVLHLVVDARQEMAGHRPQVAALQ